MGRESSGTSSGGESKESGVAVASVEPTPAPTLAPTEAEDTITFGADGEPELHAVGRERHLRHRHRHHRHLQSQASTASVNSTFYVLPPLDSILHLKESSRKYHGDECHLVHDLPVGKHVFTISTNNQYDKIYSLSHVIQWW